MLTPVLSRVMIAIEGMVDAGIRPSLRRLTEATDRKAHSRLSANIDLLVERGFVRRDPWNGEVVLVRTIADEIQGTPLSNDPLVVFVDAYQKRFSATTPSYQEICDALGIASKSEVNRRVLDLLAKGHLRTPRIDGKRSINRCLHVVKVERIAAPRSMRDDKGKKTDADV